MLEKASPIGKEINILLAILVFVIVLRYAWVSDDAYITMRSVDNFTQGYGPVYNIGERVQTFTHPLWMLLLSGVYYLFHDAFFVPIIVSLGLLIGVLWLLQKKIALSQDSLLLSFVILGSSSAFVDYSTSGLENPLTHFLLAVFYALYFTDISPTFSAQKKLFLLALVPALGAVNRMDTILLFMPALLYALYQNRSYTSLKTMAGGFIPFILWEIFSLFYYGFPFPNTAYAKLNTGIAQSDMSQQGIIYLLNSLQFDTITLITISLVLFLTLGNKHKHHLALATGILLYLLYIIRIGGDFMSGRFLSAPFLAALFLLARYPWPQMKRHLYLPVFSLFLLIGISSPYSPLWNKPLDRLMEPTGIANERLFYTGNHLLNVQAHLPPPYDPRKTQGLEVSMSDEELYVVEAAGMRGFYAGNQIHVIDYFALLDPLLARLPAKRNENWRIGHFRRVMPAGYLDTLASKSNQLEDENLALFYDKIKIITQGNVWNANRLIEIWRMNSGQYNHLMDTDTYRHPDMIQVDYTAHHWTLPKGLSWDDARHTNFAGNGLQINLPADSHAERIDINLDRGNNYTLAYYQDSQQIATQTILAVGAPIGDMFTYQLDIVPAATAQGFNKIRLFPIKTNQQQSFGYMRLWGLSDWSNCTPQCLFDFTTKESLAALNTGWAQPEPWGIWNQGATSTLHVSLDANNSYQLTIEAIPFATETCNQSIQLIMNGQEVSTAYFDSCRQQNLSFSIPPTNLMNSLNTIEFHYGQTYIPYELTNGANQDRRELAVGFISLQIQVLP